MSEAAMPDNQPCIVDRKLIPSFPKNEVAVSPRVFILVQELIGKHSNKQIGTMAFQSALSNLLPNLKVFRENVLVVDWSLE